MATTTSWQRCLGSASSVFQYSRLRIGLRMRQGPDRRNARAERSRGLRRRRLTAHGPCGATPRRISAGPRRNVSKVGHDGLVFGLSARPRRTARLAGRARRVDANDVPGSQASENRTAGARRRPASFGTVTGWPPYWDGPGMPQRAMASSRSPSASMRIIRAISSGQMPGRTGRLPVRSNFARNQSRIAAWPLVNEIEIACRVIRCAIRKARGTVSRQSGPCRFGVGARPSRSSGACCC